LSPRSAARPRRRRSRQSAGSREPGAGRRPEALRASVREGSRAARGARRAAPSSGRRRSSEAARRRGDARAAPPGSGLRRPAGPPAREVRIVAHLEHLALPLRRHRTMGEAEVPPGKPPAHEPADAGPPAPAVRRAPALAPAWIVNPAKHPGCGHHENDTRRRSGWGSAWPGIGGEIEDHFGQVRRPWKARRLRRRRVLLRQLLEHRAHPQGRLEPRLLRLRDQTLFHCVGTARLDGGTIEYAFQGDSSPNPPTPAITGGTGAFEGAGGHVDIHNVNADGSVTRDVIHITG
jgi:hypothetical protein